MVGQEASQAGSIMRRQSILTILPRSPSQNEKQEGPPAYPPPSVMKDSGSVAAAPSPTHSDTTDSRAPPLPSPVR